MTLRDLRTQFAGLVKEISHPSLIYYPACGADTIPKQTFGNNNVIHLSLPEKESGRRGGFNYFQLLGNGIKLYGDMDYSPLAENSVDLIWLKLEGITPSPQALQDFNRVLKSNGFIFVEEYHIYDDQKWENLIYSFSDYQKINLDLSISAPIYALVPTSFASDPVSSEEYEKNCRICSSKEEMMDIVTTQHLHTGIEIVPRAALFQKLNDPVV